jgi:hypothetical protein
MMKKLTAFESSVLGLLAGVLVATYLTYLRGADGFVGTVLHYVSLEFILEKIPSIDSDSLLVRFLFFVAVFIVYGFLLGIINRLTTNKGKLLVIVMILVVAVTTVDQVLGARKYIPRDEVGEVFSGAVILSAKKKVDQYYGQEVRGDVTGDGKEDIAFIVKEMDLKKDPPVEHIYLAASIDSDNGQTGTNIVYVGKNAVTKSIQIVEGEIRVEYEVQVEEEMEIKLLRARVVNGVLTIQSE